MKHLKTFNESQEIKYKDIQETIDEVLDSLSEKGKLSDSEKEFMEAASKGEIKNVTTPQLTGNFWADMANPHNMGIMWQGADGVWKQLEELPPIETVDLKKGKDYQHLKGKSKDDIEWEVKKILKRKKILKEHPGLRDDLVKLLNLFIKSEQEETKYIDRIASNFHKKWKEPYSEKNYNYNQIIDYAFNGTFHSLINQFGYWEGPGDFDFVIYSTE
jgi:uncharacterized pyridoxamine 5'-phosphate oxidase family protein